MSKWRKQRNRRKNRRPEKPVFVVRDNHRHCVEISDTKLSENEIKVAFKLSHEYDIEDCEVYGTWGWESKDDWCPDCGDPDCLQRSRNGETCCSDEPPL
jgi:hypothetical protein